MQIVTTRLIVKWSQTRSMTNPRMPGAGSAPVWRCWAILATCSSTWYVCTDEGRAEPEPARGRADAPIPKEGGGRDEEQDVQPVVVDEVDPLEVDDRSEEAVGRLDREELRLGNLDDMFELMEQLEEQGSPEDPRCIPANDVDPARRSGEAGRVLGACRHAFPPVAWRLVARRLSARRPTTFDRFRRIHAVARRCDIVNKRWRM